jgi:hypothetical protein
MKSLKISNHRMEHRLRMVAQQHCSAEVLPAEMMRAQFSNSWKTVR